MTCRPARTSLTGAALALLAGGLLGTTAPAFGDGGGVAFEPPDSPLAAVLAKAQAPGGLVLVDLFTPSCVWCGRLDRDTFSCAEVADALKGTVCVRYDAEVEPGCTLVARHHVRAYPMILFLDAGGEEVDRIDRFLPPYRFLPEVARILRGDGTLRALRAAHERDPKDARATVAFARKLVKAGDPDAALPLLTPRAAPGATPADARPGAMLGLAEAALASGDERTALAWASRVIAEAPDSDEAGRAWWLRLRLDGGVDDDQMLVNLAGARRHARGADGIVAAERLAFSMLRDLERRALWHWADRADLGAHDPEALHAAARAALEANIDLGSATAWAARAAELSGRAPEVLETWAELLARTGSPEKGLTVANEALGRATDPEQRHRLEALIAGWRPVGAGPSLPAPSPAGGAAGTPAGSAAGAPSPAPSPDGRCPEPPPAPVPAPAPGTGKPCASG